MVKREHYRSHIYAHPFPPLLLLAIVCEAVAAWVSGCHRFKSMGGYKWLEHVIKF